MRNIETQTSSEVSTTAEEVREKLRKDRKTADFEILTIDKIRKVSRVVSLQAVYEKLGSLGL